MKWKKSFICVLALILIFTVACSKSEETVKKTDDGRILVTFWHAMGGGPGEALQRMVDEFNESQDDIFVEAIYQGSYEESLNKLRQVGGSSAAPSLVQVFEVGTKFMIDSGFIIPMQEFIDAEGLDISDWEENILGYYQVDGKLYSMPFNTSNSIMFYNKDMFRQAGLDPESPPRTFSEVKEAAEKLTIRSGNNVEVHGFAILLNGWFFEQLMANQGALYLNNDNGRGGEGTEVLINKQPGLNIFNWLDEMNRAGTLGNYGRQWDDIRAAFKAEKLAMYLDSTAATSGNVNDSAFEVGTAFIPVVDGQEAQGVIVGGASIWMSNGIAEEEQKAAWEFVKFTAKPSVQAKWAGDTGYFPITKSAYEETYLQDIYAEYPQFLTTVEQLHNTTLTPATQGALMSVFPQAREEVVAAIERLYEGEDPQSALDTAATEINKALEEYKRANQ